MPSSRCGILPHHEGPQVRQTLQRRSRRNTPKAFHSPAQGSAPAEPWVRNRMQRANPERVPARAASIPRRSFVGRSKDALLESGGNGTWCNPFRALSGLRVVWRPWTQGFRQWQKPYASKPLRKDLGPQVPGRRKQCRLGGEDSTRAVIRYSAFQAAPVVPFALECSGLPLIRASSSASRCASRSVLA